MNDFDNFKKAMQFEQVHAISQILSQELRLMSGMLRSNPSEYNFDSVRQRIKFLVDELNYDIQLVMGLISDVEVQHVPNKETTESEHLKSLFKDPANNKNEFCKRADVSYPSLMKFLNDEPVREASRERIIKAYNKYYKKK
jgi:hypothetical protein